MEEQGEFIEREGSFTREGWCRLSLPPHQPAEGSRMKENSKQDKKQDKGSMPAKKKK